MLAVWRRCQYYRTGYDLLLVLFILEADSSTGAGVIGDISMPKERGGYFGTFNLGPMVSSAG
jgi:hypothetical protein